MSCCYKGCLNIQRAFSSKTFFNLPNDSRREAWINNSGNDGLQDLNPSQRRLFCEDHFDPKYLRCQFNRTILRRDAVPYPYNESQDSHEVEFIEMTGSEDENDDQIEQIQIEPTNESNNGQNNVILLLNNKHKERLSTDAHDNTVQMDNKSRSNDASPQKSKIIKKSAKIVQHPTAGDSNEVALELDLIVLDDNKTDQTTESNENGQSTPSSKRVRLEIEPSLPTQANKTSQKEAKNQNATHLMRSEPAVQPRKSIEELVSSSEALDTNNEDKYFALSVLGTLRRLTPHKRALAKCHILSYLTEIEYGGNSNSST